MGQKQFKRLKKKFKGKYEDPEHAAQVEMKRIRDSKKPVAKFKPLTKRQKRLLEFRKERQRLLEKLRKEMYAK